MNHIANCKDSMCPCNHEGRLYDMLLGKTYENKGISIFKIFLEEASNDEIFLKHFGKMILSKGISRFPKSFELKMQ